MQQPLKIIISGYAMDYLSGQPLYCFTLAREFKRQGHEVAVLSRWGMINDIEGDKLKIILESEDIICGDLWAEPFTPDIIYASEWVSLDVINRYDCPVINIIHSEYPVEAPIINDKIIHYVAIRPSIKTVLMQKYGIRDQMIVVIPNGVDRAIFNPDKRVKVERKYKVTLVPCTLDPLREKFINHMVSLAGLDHKVVFMGRDFGAKFDRFHQMIEIRPAMFEIEQAYASVDHVAGILMGRVNLEAASMGVMSSMYDPDTLDVIPFGSRFNERYDIKNVAKELLHCQRLSVPVSQ